MISSIATATLGGALPEKLEAVAQAGFDAVELFMTDLDGFDGALPEVRALLGGFDFDLASYFPLRDVDGMPGAKRAAAFDKADRFFDFAAGLGAGMVMMTSNTDEESVADPDTLAADLNDLGDMAAARGLKLAYEALAWGRHLYDYRQARDLVLHADHPAVGLVLDTFHIFARGLDLAPITDIPAERIFLVQISDSTMMDLDYINWSRQYRVLPGQAAFALDEFTAALKQTGYDGIVSLECFSESLRTPPPGVVAVEALDSLNQLWTSAPVG